MNTIKYITLSVFLTFGFCNYLIAQNNTTIDSQKKSIEQSKEVFEKNNKLRLAPVKVKIISTCSTEPELCGNMAFGSVSLVKILEGEYLGETIYVASTCSETNFKVDHIYKLSASYEPGFSVNLCNGKTYNSNWNYKLDTNEYFIVFGSLNSISIID